MAQVDIDNINVHVTAGFMVAVAGDVVLLQKWHHLCDVQAYLHPKLGSKRCGR